MKAPIYAYVVGEDNNFLKVVSRDSSGVYRSFVNNGGQSGTGSGGITPVDPDGPVQVQP